MPFPHDLAISFASEQAWIADAISWLVGSHFRVYCSLVDPTEVTRAEFRDKLATTYLSSRLNLMIWSDEYCAKSDIESSPVYVEYHALRHRHIVQHQPDSLIVIAVNPSVHTREFSSMGRLILTRSQEGLPALHNRILRTLEVPSDLDPEVIYVHPQENAQLRGEIFPCKIKTFPQFRKHPGWRDKSDIQVEIISPRGLNQPYPFLIPCGRVPVRLRNVPDLRRTPGNLALKRLFSEEFIHRVRDTPLNAVYFEMYKDGKKSVKVYCKEYDDALITGINAVNEGRGAIV